MRLRNGDFHETQEAVFILIIILILALTLYILIHRFTTREEIRTEHSGLTNDITVNQSAPDTANMAAPANIEGIDFSNPVDAAKKQ